MANSRLCSIQNCDKPVSARGFCSRHFNRLLRYGDPLAGGKNRDPKGSVQKYLMDVALRYDGDECLIWPYSKNGEGYGQVSVNGKTTLVSRIVCKSAHGAPPHARMDAAHSCGNGHLGCVAKGHLSWKSRSDNNMDKVSHNTHNRGERNPNAKLTEEQVRYILAHRSQMTCRILANRFGVDPSTIHSIIERKSWTWIEG